MASSMKCQQIFVVGDASLVMDPIWRSDDLKLEHLFNN